MGLVGLRFWNQVIFQLLAILSIFTACCILLEDFFELWLLDERFRIVLESSFVGLLLDVDSDFNIIGVDAIQCGLLGNVVEGELCCVSNIGDGGANGFGTILGAMLRVGSDLTLSTTAGKSGRDSA